MGHQIHRTQPLAGYRSFTAIPVQYIPPATKPSSQKDATQAWISTPLAEHDTLKKLVDSFNDITFRRPVMLPVGAQAMSSYDWMTEQERAEMVPSPYRSAYKYANHDRAVPLIMLDVSPTFYLSSEVNGALANSIDAVCQCEQRTRTLAQRVRELMWAQYDPDKPYRPSPTGSIFESETIALPDDASGKPWSLHMRSATGVYSVDGRSYMGVFVHGIAVPRPGPSAGPCTHYMLPGTELETSYHLTHRGQLPPTSLYFDMFVPVEPEIVTHEWGWGEGLEELITAKEENAKLSPRWLPPFIGNKWDRKSRTHKTATQIRLADARKEHRDYELSLRLQLKQQERERARKVLYTYSWKALLLAVIECKQLIVEEREC